MNKRGIEPIIATILLIVITVLLITALVFFIIPFVRDSLEKSQICSDAKANIKEVCISDNLGTNNNAIWTDEGIYNGAYLFNGDNSYIDITQKDAFQFGTGNFTLEAWVNPRTSGDQGIISKWGGFGSDAGYWIGIYQNKITFAVYNNSNKELNFNNYIQSEENVTLGSWIHIVGIREKVSDNQAKISLYTNNSLKNSAIIALDTCDNEETLKIGLDSFYLPWYFFGKIDEVKIYNKALTQEEIQQNYENNKVYDGLISYWNFDNSKIINDLGITKVKIASSKGDFEISRLIFGLNNDEGTFIRESNINLGSYEEKQISLIGIENLKSVKVAVIVKKGTKEINCDYSSEFKEIGNC